MSAHKMIVQGFSVFVAMTALISGCYIQHDGNFNGESDGEPTAGQAGVCKTFCEELVGCDTVAQKDQDACIDHCNAEHALVPYTTEQGALCVIEEGCKPIADYTCPGAPFPKLASASNDGGSACSANCDCPSGDVCQNSVCKTPCGASCDCGEGEVCDAGYCEVPAAPPMSCNADCDCPSGDECVDGVCATL